ncbi:MAG: DNA adenine methylase [Candidatus Aminicenantes bacterium]
MSAIRRLKYEKDNLAHWSLETKKVSQGDASSNNSINMEGFTNKEADNFTTEEIYRFDYRNKKGIEEGFPNLSIANHIEPMGVGHIISRFPSTRYYGSKRRILTWIFDNIKDLPFTKVLDGFGGTASVSLLFKAMEKEVTYHDALSFNTISAHAVLSNYNPIKSFHEIDDFFDSIQPQNGFITKTFKGKYYTDEENSWLDGVIPEILSINSFRKRCILLYCLFQACLKKRPFNLFHRSNLYLRQNRNVKKTFGNQTTWDTPFTVFAKQAYRELSRAIWNSGCKHHIIEPSDISKIKPGYDLVYFDPPYINPLEHANDYLKRYHFLEGFIQYNHWPSKINKNCKTLSFFPIQHIKEWNNKSTFKARLFNLILKHRSSIVVLSYVKNAYPSVNYLMDFFNQNFTEVRVSELELNYALSKQKKKEILIIGVPG